MSTTQHEIIANAEVISIASRRPVDSISKNEVILSNDFAEALDSLLELLPFIPNLYSHNGRLELVDATGAYVLCDSTLLALLARECRFFIVLKTRAMKESPPTERHLSAILKRGVWDGVPILQEVRRSPCLGRDGQVHSEGFRDGTLVFSHVALSVPATPTLQDARDSAKALCDLVRDFPFKTDSDRSAWLAMVLTLVARPFIDGNCPMFSITANAPGSGKTLLTQLASIIALGRETSVQSAPRKESDEGPKVVFSTLLAGQPYAILDNTKGVLDSPDLEMALTSAEYTGRILGQSKNGTIPCRTIWAATGNALQLSTDLARRSLFIRLECGAENPEERTNFEQADLLAYTLQVAARDRRYASRA